jgi:hypothetical protein
LKLRLEDDWFFLRREIVLDFFVASSCSDPQALFAIVCKEMCVIDDEITILWLFAMTFSFVLHYSLL